MRLTNREPNLFEKREQINPIKKPCLSSLASCVTGNINFCPCY